MFKGYAIIPPVSPWDEKHKEAIQLDNARRTIGSTEAEAWDIHCQFGVKNTPKSERSRIIQHWHDRGYRVAPVRVEIIEIKEE